MSGAAVDYARLAFDLIEGFDRMTTPAQVLQHLSSALRAFGYNSFLIGSAPNPADGKAEPLVLLNGWPAEWTEHYVREECFKDDPIAAWTVQSVTPFYWCEAKYDPEQWPRAAEIMRIAYDLGLKEGFVVPVVRTGYTDAVTMAGEHPDHDGQAKRAIHLISLYAHAKVLSLVQREPLYTTTEVLTPGEREVLSWIAAGKSSWDVSVILGISRGHGDLAASARRAQAERGEPNPSGRARDTRQTDHTLTVGEVCRL